MSNRSGKTACVVGMIVGVIIIIVGFLLQDTSSYYIGRDIEFGGDYQTNMYDVTKNVGHAINYAINDLICAVGWLIISLGAIDICFFAYKMSTCSTPKNVDKSIQLSATSTKRKDEEKAKREHTEKARQPKQERQPKQSSAEEKSLSPMAEPRGFKTNAKWKKQISELSTEEIIDRYLDNNEWAEGYRYQCYLELKGRKVSKYKPAKQSQVKDETQGFIANPTGEGYLCPVCKTGNQSFSPCLRCGYTPPVTEANDADDGEYVDIICPTCRELLSFLANEKDAVCPWCNTKISFD